MENASKALIIAGAILLAILLISLGIMIFNQASNTVSNSGMSEAEITAFNNKFTKYEGDQTGSMVKSMCQEVLAVNSNQANQDSNRFISVTLKKSSGAGETIISGPSKGAGSTVKIENNKKYNVVLNYNASSGLIYWIYINE